MTIKEFAKEQGISTQAVYQRLKKNKIRVEAVTEKGTGEITGEGQTILERLFDPENRQTKPPKDEQIDAMADIISELRAEVAKKDERIANLQSDCEKAREETDRWIKAFIKEQELSLSLLKSLPAPEKEPKKEEKPAPTQPQRLTWRERLTGKRRPVGGKG